MITPRWLFVIAGATPVDLVGDPIIVDEPVTAFDPEQVRPGDIVGVGIHSGNCLPGYRVVRDAKARGAIVIVGGIHATLFPDEPAQYGADAIVTGNGDLVWKEAVADALRGSLKTRYEGGRVPGDQLVRARWDLVDPSRYMLASVQTIVGCPENCSFCSVWVTEGRNPRQHTTEQVISEVRELWQLGFRYVLFADDNFNPATLGRIQREKQPRKREQLERLRAERLAFFEDYAREAPPDLYAFTQMTIEVASDPEYLAAMRDKMRIRGALVGIESFDPEGLKAVNKTWNPNGDAMVRSIREIQEQGIFILASVIGGLESDRVETLVKMRELVIASGAAMSQFPTYTPYPGTVDYHEMVRDLENARRADYAPKHEIRLLKDRFWLSNEHFEVQVEHPEIRKPVLVREIQKSWKAFYSLKATFGRLRRAPMSQLSTRGRLMYTFGCFAFRILYSKGIGADNANNRRLGWMSKLVLRMAFAFARNPDDSLLTRRPSTSP